MTKSLFIAAPFTALYALPLACMAFAQPARADSHSWRIGPESYHVYSTGLDLGTSAGRAGLLARLERAAGKLCQGGVRVAQQSCVADAMTRAAAQPAASALRIALAERRGVAVAAR